jgi:hypothetical protein
MELVALQPTWLALPAILGAQIVPPPDAAFGDGFSQC